MRHKRIILPLAVVMALAVITVSIGATSLESIEAPKAVADVPQNEAESIPTYVATLQAQAAQLEQALSERQATYAEQVGALEAAQATMDQNLSALEQQELLLRGQLDAIRSERDSRNAQYAQQLEQLQWQYADRAAEITAHLNEAEIRLGEANQRLGR